MTASFVSLLFKFVTESLVFKFTGYISSHSSSLEFIHFLPFYLLVSQHYVSQKNLCCFEVCLRSLKLLKDCSSFVSPPFVHSPSKALSAQKRSANDKNNAAGGNMQSQSTKQVSSFMLESVVTLISGVNLNLLLFLRMILTGMFFNRCSFLIIP